MNGQLDQRTVLLMLVGCGTVYVAFEHPSLAPPSSSVLPW